MKSSRNLVLGFVSVFAAALASAQLTIVEENNPALTYSHAFEWLEYKNPQALGDGTVDDVYWHGGSARAVSTPGASVSLTFNGSRIAFYGDMNNDHGKLGVVVDGQETILDTFHAAGAAKQVKLFETTVDGTVANHVITVTCLERRPVSFDYFEYDLTQPAPVVSTTQDESSAALPTGNQQSPSTPTSGNKTPMIITAVLAALGWLLVLLLGLFIIRTRIRTADKTLEALPVHNASPGVLSSITSSMSPTVRASSRDFESVRIGLERMGEKQRMFLSEFEGTSWAATSTISSSINGATTASTTRPEPISALGPNPPAYSGPV